MGLGVVVGNLKAGSRTLDAAVTLARKLGGEEPSFVIDVVTLGAGLLALGDKSVEEARDRVMRAQQIVVASPTYKATYSGVLKTFLDQFPTDGLAGVVALPMMMGAAPNHALAPDLLLKPVLVEMGATCPMPGLYLMEKTYQDDPRIDAWVSRAKPLLASLSS
jgi:FMN reductase